MKFPRNPQIAPSKHLSGMTLHGNLFGNFVLEHTAVVLVMKYRLHTCNLFPLSIKGYSALCSDRCVNVGEIPENFMRTKLKIQTELEQRVDEEDSLLKSRGM